MSSTLDLEIGRIEAKVRADDPDAYAQASKLVEQYPDEARALALRAYVLGTLRNWAKAIEDLSSAIEILPTEPSLLFARGRYFVKQGDYQHAIEDFTRGLAACDLHSNDYYREELRFHRADAYLRRGDKRAALEDLKAVRDGCSIWTDSLHTKKEMIARCIGT